MLTYTDTWICHYCWKVHFCLHVGVCVGQEKCEFCCTVIVQYPLSVVSLQLSQLIMMFTRSVLPLAILPIMCWSFSFCIFPFYSLSHLTFLTFLFLFLNHTSTNKQFLLVHWSIQFCILFLITMILFSSLLSILISRHLLYNVTIWY